MTIEIEILAYLGWVLLSTVAIILIMATLRQGAKWLLRVHLKPYPTIACVLGGYAILADHHSRASRTGLLSAARRRSCLFLADPCCPTHCALVSCRLGIVPF